MPVMNLFLNWCKGLSSKEALNLLSEAQVPAGPVNNLSDVLKDELAFIFKAYV